jgi:hypothetical protein
MQTHQRNRIDELAWEIYGLVWANRGDEAEKGLRGLGGMLSVRIHERGSP